MEWLFLFSLRGGLCISNVEWKFWKSFLISFFWLLLFLISKFHLTSSGNFQRDCSNTVRGYDQWMFVWPLHEPLGFSCATKAGNCSRILAESHLLDSCEVFNGRVHVRRILIESVNSQRFHWTIGRHFAVEVYQFRRQFISLFVLGWVFRDTYACA